MTPNWLLTVTIVEQSRFELKNFWGNARCYGMRNEMGALRGKPPLGVVTYLHFLMKQYELPPLALHSATCPLHLWNGIIYELALKQRIIGT